VESNVDNFLHWGVVVEFQGKVIEGGIREAVGRGLVKEANCHHWWGLLKRDNGDVYDEGRIYGEEGIVYGRLVDGVAVPL